MTENKTYIPPEYIGFVCPRCGWVIAEGYAGAKATPTCPICYHDLTRVDEEWKIRCKDYDKYYKITTTSVPEIWDQDVLRARSHFKEFFDKYVKSSPEYDQWDYEHPIENYEMRNREYDEYWSAKKKYGAVPECPNCNFKYTYRSSGIMNKIRGRNWHCPKCKMDF